jgi:small subunit ribosomal protein S8e
MDFTKYKKGVQMEQFHGKSRRKVTGSGGIIRKFRDKKLHEVGGAFSATKVSEKADITKKSCRGRKFKIKLKQAAFANLATKEGVKKVKIKAVLESPDNRHYTRMNVITKGAVIDTELGKAKVKSRPGQHGIVNAVLIEK